MDAQGRPGVWGFMLIQGRLPSMIIGILRKTGIISENQTVMQSCTVVPGNNGTARDYCSRLGQTGLQEKRARESNTRWARSRTQIAQNVLESSTLNWREPVLFPFRLQRNAEWRIGVLSPLAWGLKTTIALELRQLALS